MRPLRAFPLALSVGTDICQIARIHDILAGPRRERFMRRILAPEELAAAARDGRWLLGLGAGEEGGVQAAAAAAAGGGGGGGGGRGGAGAGAGGERTGLWRTAVFVAGRFAAKEAAIKAHAQRRRRLGWHDIVVERRDGEAPVARIKAGDSGEDESALVSISHDGDYATAVCIACRSGEGSAVDADYAESDVRR